MRNCLILLLLTSIILFGCSSRRQQSGTSEQNNILIFAAASLQDVLKEIGLVYANGHSVTFSYNFAGSNVLARQLAAAPVADIYFSASEHWMDYAQQAGVILPGSRRTFLSNGLVIIGRQSSHWQITSPSDLASLDYKFLSLANPDAIPAGRYAREWLQSISLGDSTLWAAVKDRVAPGPDVRAALGLVEADPGILGIVYRTDAAISNRVRVLYRVPLDQGPSIRYAVALVANRPHEKECKEFLRFLNSPQSREIFTNAGFVPLNP